MPDARPIEDVLMELAAEVPDEEWARLPADLSANLDHYLYGCPKVGTMNDEQEAELIEHYRQDDNPGS